MQENKKYCKDENDSGKQYGKKGRKPRNMNREVTYTKMEDIQSNDPRYYNKTSMFDNVTKFTWPLIVGQQLKPGDLLGKKWLSSAGYSTLPNARYTVPAGMKIDVVTGPGWASSVQDGVNRSLAVLMAQIRSSLSTNQIGFETADLGLFLTSTSSISMLLGYARKLIAARNEWMSKNYVYPRGFYKMHGLDYDVENARIQQTIVAFNQAVDMFNNMQIPDFSDVYDRQFALMNNVYLDEDSQYGQIYSFAPVNYYTYQDTSGTALYTSMPASSTGLPGIIGAAQSLLNAWYTSSDLFNINGVLQRSFKDHPRLRLQHVSLDDVITPITDRFIIMQVQNMSIIPLDIPMSASTAAPAEFNITQDPSDPTYIKWTPYVSTTTWNQAPIVGDYHLLRVFEDDLSADDNMEMTRLLTFCNPETSPDSANNDVHFCNMCGPEIVFKVTVGYYDTVRDTYVQAASFDSNYVDIDPANTSDAANAIALSGFRYIPTIYAWSKPTGSSTVPTFVGIIGDFYNYMLYSRSDYIDLNNVALQSIWIPKSIDDKGLTR